MKMSKKYPTIKEAREWINALVGSPTDEELCQIYERDRGYPPSEEQLASYHRFVDGIKEELTTCSVTATFEKADYVPTGWKELFDKLLEVRNG